MKSPFVLFPRLFFTAAIVLAATSTTRVVAAPLPGAAGASSALRIAADAPSLRTLRDMGPAPSTLPVRIALTLKYQHEPELQRLIEAQSDPRSVYYHRFLSNNQFAAYFAPLAAQEAFVVATLLRAGFTVNGRYANRSVIDAVAPAATVERYFSTQIHRFAQPAHGTRYATVTPALIPTELSAAVATVSGLSNVARVRPQIAFADGRQKLAARTRAARLDDGFGARLVGTRVAGWPARTSNVPALSTGNELSDPGFESGQFGTWQRLTSSSDAAIQKGNSHSGTYAAFMGSPTATSGEINGDSGVTQPVTIPTGGVLSFWAAGGTNEPNAAHSWQEADLLDGTGKRIVNFFAVARSANWTHITLNVGASAGKRVYLYFGVHGNGDPHHHTFLYIDDLSLSGSAYPATGAPIGGPLSGPDGGYGPAVIANDYDFPVQHRFDGAGRATGITISGDYSDADLNGYLAEFGITRGGATTRVPVDGGATYDPTTADTEEATLDVETIVALAPATHVYMYLIPDLGDVSILDGYNQAISDNRVDVLNSSFGGCEIGDQGFNLGVYRLAAQGAAKGITFSASSGDQGSQACTDSFGLAAIGVNTPASVPNVVAVGGTSLNINQNGSYLSESGWDGSTGGVSSVWQKPAYQVGFPGIAGAGRNVPDIAFAADPFTGSSYYLAGVWQGPIGGTSWSSPIFCALQTEIDQRDNSRFGYVNPLIYGTFSKDGGYRLFNDVTDGSNGDYNAVRGYDRVTGIGSVRGFSFAAFE